MNHESNFSDVFKIPGSKFPLRRGISRIGFLIKLSAFNLSKIFLVDPESLYNLTADPFIF
jgi:hypothetical protein